MKRDLENGMRAAADEEALAGTAMTDDWAPPEVVPQMANAVEILATDGLPAGVIMRVRQRAARVDHMNGNDREYPRDVWGEAADEARKRARAGVMISEFRHPQTVTLNDADYYVSRPDEETGTVDDISEPDADGWVTIDRSIRDTPRGREVADAINRGAPYGLSTRMHLAGDPVTRNGRRGLRARKMRLHTWDDVPNPAVAGAGQLVPLSDSQMAGMSPNGPDPAFFTSAPRAHNNGGTTVNPVLKALNALNVAIARRAPKAELTRLRTAVTDAMADTANSEANVDLSEFVAKLAKADELIEDIGYNPDRKAPEGVEAAAGEPGEKPPVPGGTETTRVSDKTEGEGALGATDAKGITAEDIEFIRQEKEARARSDAQAKLNAALTTAAENCAALKGLSDSQRAYVLEQTRAKVTDTAKVADVLNAEADALAKIVANQRLDDVGGTAVTTRTGGVTKVTPRDPTWMEGVSKIISATDDHRRRTEGFDPNSVRRLRAFNMDTFVHPLIKQWTKQSHGRSVEEFMAAQDSEYSKGERAFVDSLFGKAAGDATTSTSTMYSAPTIIMALLIESFFETRALQFTEGIGPVDGNNNPNGGWFSTGNSGDGRVGRIFRIPVEYYVAPANYGIFAPPSFDAGLKTPEDTAIDSGSVRTNWLTFGPTWRRIAINVTKDVVKQMGNGPENYDVIARHLYHISRDKSRRIDLALMNEMADAADYYGAVAVTNESVNLTNNSVYKAAGGVTVNLNPAKTASTAPAATDDQVTYGSNVIGAIRLVGPGAGTYFGEVNGAVPIVRPKLLQNFDQNGAYTSSLQYPVALSAPAAAVEGYMDGGTGMIQQYPGGSTPTYAIDYVNGVILFTSGVTGTGSVLTTAVTVASYSYVTNFDDFTINNIQPLGLLATGETPQMYYNRLFGQLDKTRALMGGYPRVRPGNLALMSMNVMAYLTQSTIFYQMNNPKDTEYLPTEDYKFYRNSMWGAEFNAPWRVADKQILLTVKGATKYAVDTPFEIEGPYQSYDPTTGNPKDSKFFYGSENSAVFTPMILEQDQQTILNPPSRWIRLR